MEGSDVLDETITTSLLEEVFNTVDSQTEPASTSKGSFDKTSASALTSFLEQEYQTDLDVALGKKKSVEIKKKSTVRYSNPKLEEKECSVIYEDDVNPSKEDDPFDEGEGTKWITSGVILQSNPKKPSNNFSDGTSKKWSDLKSLQEKLNETIKKVTAPEDASKDLLVDPVFYMRIINPKVSTTILKNRMVGREAVPPVKIKKYLESHDVKDVNWVTGGAVTGKFITTSQKGNPYCIWSVSDLRGDIKTISVFLFGSAYTEFWKLPLGTVVGILNPSLLNNKNSKIEATLKVDSSDRIMVFGTSKDYGTCKSKKSNGEQCTAVVNKTSCEYCVYHVKQAYDKASRRLELQSNFTGKGLTNLRNKVLGKNEVFYGGKSYTALHGKQSVNSAVKEREKIRTLLEAPPDPSKAQKDRELLQRLSGGVKTKSTSNVAQNSPSNTNGAQSRLSTPRDLAQSKPQLNDSGATKPKIEKMIDLDLPITSKQVLRAKANAIRFIREKGPLKKPQETKHGKKTPDQILSIKRKVEAEEGKRKKMKTADGTETENDPKSLLKQKMERSGITEKFLKLMNSEPENAQLLTEAENEEREKYFSRLEIREKMEEKMASTYKMDCKAVRCLKCNYKSFSASELCKKEKHPLKLVNAVKRFWKCGDCSARTVCLELVPLHSCKVCGSSKWERASMLPEKKTALVPNEPLSIRGHEEKFVGSCVRNPNINLLVPDEAS